MFLSYKTFCEWISIFFWFSSCTFLYEWLSILFYVFVMHISVKMTIHIILGFCHAHLCTNDYPDYFRFLSCTSLYKWISRLLWVFVIHISIWMTLQIIMGFCHAHIFTNDYPYYYWFCHAHICMDDYFIPNLFPVRFCKTGIFSYFLASFAGINRWGRSPWCLSSRGEFLGFFSSNVLVSPSAQRSPMRE